METANYGRMNLCRCITKDVGHLACQTDVLHLTDWICSGKAHCDIRIPDEELDLSRPCPPNLKVYLEASFKCVKGIINWTSTMYISYVFQTRMSASLEQG